LTKLSIAETSIERIMELLGPERMIRKWRNAAIVASL
jgi:hypothetical protein